MDRTERNVVSSNESRNERIGLVGCVKRKRACRAPARDLYVSPLFRGRRRYVEATCSRWYVLSARHGLVDPGQMLDPYDESLTDARSDRRRTWSSAVLGALDTVAPDHRTVTYEIHAGAAYRDHGLVDGLLDRGAAVELPAAGLSQGQQLAFYARGPSAMAEADTDSDLVARPRLGPSAVGSSPRRATSSEARGGKYAPLAAWLRESTPLTVSLTFTTIERLLGDPLPASSRRHRAWWANDP